MEVCWELGAVLERTDALVADARRQDWQSSKELPQLLGRSDLQSRERVSPSLRKQSNSGQG
jgi:hypothetical protein